MARILLAEDEDTIAQLVEMTLRVSGHQTHTVQDGCLAAQCLADGGYDLAILDIMLPGLDGFAMVEALQRRQVALPPFLFLTARIEVADRVRGLNLGADDYLLKPFHPVELQARVGAVLRRHAPQAAVYRAYDVVLDTATRLVTRRGRRVPLTPQEYALLEMLMCHQNMALNREQLLQAAWGFDYLGGSRTVDMHIQRLRKKLGWEKAIVTVYKLGYRLETNA